MSEIDILNNEWGKIKYKDMTAITFYGMIAKKINGQPTFNPTVLALSRLVATPPLGNKLPDSEKLLLLAKLTSLGIEI